MRFKKNKRAITTVAFVILAGAAALSKPGRSALTRVFPSLRLDPAAAGAASPSRAAAVSSPSAAPQAGQDVEQRARATHGWTPQILDSVIRGNIDFYEASGEITRQATLVLYREYPDRVRVELTSGGATDVSGFDGNNEWKPGASQLATTAARDIRAWLRFGPERLFVSRDGGMIYQESGRAIDNHIMTTPWAGPRDLNPPRVYNRVLIEDFIGPGQGLGQGQGQGIAKDRRFVNYYVTQPDSIVVKERWLEPIDPQVSVDDPKARMLDETIDFSAWQRINGVLWPFEITHWLGGKVDFRIEVTQVQMNQHPAGNLFQKP